MLWYLPPVTPPTLVSTVTIQVHKIIIILWYLPPVTFSNSDICCHYPITYNHYHTVISTTSYTFQLWYLLSLSILHTIIIILWYLPPVTLSSFLIFTVTIQSHIIIIQLRYCHYGVTHHHHNHHHHILPILKAELL